MERCTASPVDPSTSCGSMWSCSSDVEEGFMQQEEEEVTSSPSLYDMSDLMAVLPIKKGLSKHYKGKSQSFTSLACARCLEDLPKPERQIGKKATKEAVGGEKRRYSSLSCCSKIMKKKGFKCSSPLPGRRLQEFRATAPPHRSQRFPNEQSMLFA